MFKLNCYQNPVVVTAKAPPAYAATLLPLGENPLLDLIFVYWFKNINIHIYSIYLYIYIYIYYMHIHIIHRLPGTPMIFILEFLTHIRRINQPKEWLMSPIDHLTIILLGKKKQPDEFFNHGIRLMLCLKDGGDVFFVH